MNDKLQISLSGITLANPIIPASGTYGFGDEFAELYDINCAQAALGLLDAHNLEALHCSLQSADGVDLGYDHANSLCGVKLRHRHKLYAIGQSRQYFM